MFHKPGTRIHFVGIGGIGMSGIAEVLLTLGYAVSGSDQKESDTTRRLAELGATIALGHDAAHVGAADVVVISSAVKSTNPEVGAARRRGIPVIPRAEMLAELMRMKYGIAVAGSHGKTTTTSLVATVLHQAGLDPTAVIGGKLPSLGSNARLGGGEYLVAEADESDGSFMKLTPTVAVVTNIDPEHLDHYGTLESLKQTFVDFINKVPFYGLAVLCVDHEHVQSILPSVEKRHTTYGFTPLANFRAVDVAFDGLRTTFTAIARGKTLGRVELAMPGRHNVLNSLAVLAVAGSHGKTTTTSLVATVLHAAGLDPTAVIGGKLPSLGSNARLGGGDYLVAEADESDGSFMKLTPTVAVVTNIDPEHLDHYGTLESLKQTFVDFINKVPF
ncbi:MAG TPA: UDP-N-acetylmuramate--L-alanine ligase, partial [Polyangia bacterium]|nr:UDP-N-acetylmuramate--L-alanine ligase [Polyangia bacterium]